MYDIVFISYNEFEAEQNWEDLKKRFPRAKRVDGVKGIHQAHITAAKKCFTKMFWVVDADAKVLDTFDFSYKVNEFDLETVHVWRSQNPINGLVYGYGGIKLLPRKLTINMDTSKPDMTTSISKHFKPMQEIANITAFNTDEFSTWRSAFRECAKLSSKSIQGQIDEETEARLTAWTTNSYGNFSEYALRGAWAGMEFGLSNSNSLQLINDFDWLYERFQQNTLG